MKIFGKIFLLMVILTCFSCDDQSLIVNCPDCLSSEPQTTDLEIKLKAPESGAATLINVYEGNLEDNVLYSSFTTLSNHTSVTVKINKKYTVTATYFVSDNSYIAVDSATPRVKFDKNQCDNPCYFIYDKRLDLRLKYTD